MDYSCSFLGQVITATIDRQAGSRHPKHGFVYPINYGFIANTKAPDGEEVDAYVLGVDEPLLSFTGKCIAIIHRINDEDDKLILANEGKAFTDEEIISLTNFQEQWFQSKIIR
jgi:inorganic pyrophosphatase